MLLIAVVIPLDIGTNK